MSTVIRSRQMEAPSIRHLLPPAPTFGRELLSHLESASFLRLAPRTLARHRADGTGPVFIRLGRRILYHPDDLRAWAQQHRYRSTSEPTITTPTRALPRSSRRA